LAITNTGGFAAKPDAKALALSPQKKRTAQANNDVCSSARAKRGSDERLQHARPRNEAKGEM